jgi:outer membrane protein assembly factor BamB
VTLIDPTSGRQLLAPFQPPLRGGEVFDWRTPIVLDDEQFVIADGRTKLYRVEIRDRPQPHLAAAVDAEAASTIVSSLALLDDRIFAATAENKLVSFKLPTLEPAESLSTEGSVVLGPVRVGGQVLFVTDRERLVCVNGDGSQRWAVELRDGPLSGAPIEFDGAIYCAAIAGIVWRLDTQTGAETARVDLGEALASSPTPDGQRLLVAARDGTVLAVLPPRP